MTLSDERYLDLDVPEGHGDRDAQRARADLDRAYGAAPPPPLRARMDRVVYERMAAATPADARIVPLRQTQAARATRGARRRLVSLVAALTLALGGLTGYLRWQAPTPVSAQTILRHAATTIAAPSPDMALHDVVVVTYGPNMAMGTALRHNMIDANTTITADVWTQFDATGAISRQVTAATGVGGAPLWRVLQTGHSTAWIYDARDNAVANMGGVKGTSFAGTFIIGTPYGVDDLHQFVTGAATGTASDAHLRGQQVLGDRMVYVVDVGVDAMAHGTPGWAQRFYIDMQDYTVRGVDAIGTDAQGGEEVEMSDRVVRRAVVPAASVPADTFTLGTPANAPTVTFTPAALPDAQAVPSRRAVLRVVRPRSPDHR